MKFIRILNLATFGLTLVVNWLSNALPINGRNTGEISDSFPVLFTPAGYVFAIWGLIYLLLSGFAVYQALPSQQNNPRIERIGYWFVASNLFNSVWIFFWHYGLLPLTEIAMLGLLVSLIVIYLRLEIGRRPAASTVEKIWLNLPFSVYLGWITVATVANTTILLYDLGWNGGAFGPQLWAVLVILVALGLGVAMIQQRSEIAYPLVLVWAFIGIFVKQAPTPLVAWTAALGALALVAVLVGRNLLARFRPVNAALLSR